MTTAFSPLKWVKDFIKMLEGKVGELLGNIEKNAVTVMKRLWERTSTGELAQEWGVNWFDVLMDIVSLLLGMPPSSVFGALALNKQLKHGAFKEFIERLAGQVRHDVDMLISMAAEDGHETPEEVALKLVLLAYKRGIEKARPS